LGQKIGLQPSGQINEEPLMMALNFSKNSVVYFIISGLGKEADYIINWNDGEKLSGQIGFQDKKIIEHKWQKSGSYLVVAELKSKDNETRKFSIPIIINE
jgi:hypothetical protein